MVHLPVLPGETIYQPEDVARALLDSVKKDEYTIACGDFGCSLLARATVGMAPRNNIVLDMLLLGPILPLVGYIYRKTWDSIVMAGPGVKNAPGAEPVPSRPRTRSSSKKQA